MATITYNPLVDDARRKVGRMVLSKWKQTNYFRKFRKPGGTPSAEQIEVRSAFSVLVDIWQELDGVMQSSWDSYVKKLNLNMTGYNAFIGRNSSRLRNSEALELFKEFGENPVASLSTSAGAAGSIVCAFTMPAGSAAKHAAFFTQRLADGKGTAEIRMHEAGADPASPFTITGLEPSAQYFVYAVVTDAAYADANAVSIAVSVSAAAGA